jgi:lipopolysaccharide/colanic/teichoic acid biosynthesis glycosyltransferase
MNHRTVSTDTRVGLPFQSNASRIELFLKRTFDVALSSVGLFISAPLWLLIAVLVKREDSGTVFYTQLRVGKNGTPFRVLKFRSMVVNAEKETGAVWAVQDDPRVTRVGRILRATAMDELPQLWNIFKGDMSFVGPRAERPDLVDKFAQAIPGYRDRFRVRPGLTGLAQVYGQYDTPAHHKLKYDRLYIRRASFCLDLKLILLSFLITFRGKWEYRGKKV